MEFDLKHLFIITDSNARSPDPKGLPGRIRLAQFEMIEIPD